MPAPSPAQIQTFLTNALIAKGFVKKTYVSGALITDPTQLPEKLAELVSGISNGGAQQWTAWQTAQIVNIPVTSVPGTPSAGNLP